MSDRYRGFITWAVIAGLIFTIIVALRTADEFQQSNREQAAAAAAYEKYAQQDPKCVLTSGLEPWAACLEKKIETDYQYHHQAADLRAQQTVAGWTGGLFWIGFFSFWTSIAALAFLVVNLRAVQEQTRETRGIGEDQTKAYLAPVAVRSVWRADGELKLWVTHKNGGQTPASKVQEYVLFQNQPRPPDWANHADPASGEPRPAITGGAADEFPVGLWDFAEFEKSVAPQGEGTVHSLWVYVFYTDVFGQLYRSGACFIAHNLKAGSGKRNWMLNYQYAEVLFERAPEEHQPRNQPKPKFPTVYYG